MPAMTREEAMRLADDALGFMCEAEETFAPLLFESGLSPKDLTEGSDDPKVLGAVLDYMLSREETLQSFCQESNIEPELVYRARQLLPGPTPTPL
jgi:hypothetical protein